MNLAASTLATSGSPPPFLRHRIRVPLRVPLRGGDGAAAGASELRGVVEKMGEFLGAAHQETVKWRDVLDETQRSC